MSKSMAKESIEHYERLLIRLQQQLSELEMRQATRKGIAASVKPEILFLEATIEELKCKIFSKRYPKLENFRYYIKIIPNMIFWFLLIASILWCVILFQKFFGDFQLRILLNIFCVFSSTAIVSMASRIFYNARRKQTKYFISSIILENPAFFSAIKKEVFLIVQNESVI